jgi:hypothetical protein
MDKGKFFSGLFIMIGLIVIGFHISGAVAKYRSYDRTVNVKGLCEKEVKADKVIWPVVYKVMANDIQSVYDQIDANNATVISFLESGGIKTDEISVAVPNISDKYATEYGSNDRTYRYIATGIVTVCTSDVDAVLALRAKVNLPCASASAFASSPICSDWYILPPSIREALRLRSR